MLICADAPIINNPAHHYRPGPGDAYDMPSLPMALERKGLTWETTGATWVPCLVLGPYARPHHISSQENSHVSILKFCEGSSTCSP